MPHFRYVHPAQTNPITLLTLASCYLADSNNCQAYGLLARALGFSVAATGGA